MYHDDDGRLNVELSKLPVNLLLTVRDASGTQSYHLAWPTLRETAKGLLEMSFRLNDLGVEINEAAPTEGAS